MQNNKFWLQLAIVMSFGLLLSSCKSKTTEPVDDTPKRMEILFLGHRNNSNHDSHKLAGILSREYFRSGINMSFRDNPEDLNKENLDHYAGLIIYANHYTISACQADALRKYVMGGKG